MSTSRKYYTRVAGRFTGNGVEIDVTTQLRKLSEIYKDLNDGILVENGSILVPKKSTRANVSIWIPMKYLRLINDKYVTDIPLSEDYDYIVRGE